MEAVSMSHKIAKDAVVKLLEGRYDFQSARNVLAHALKEAGVEDKSEYSSEELDSLCGEIEKFATHVSELVEKLNALGKGGADKPAPKAEDKPAPKAEDKPAPKAEDKPAPKAEDTPAAKAEDKPAAKADDKPAAKADDKADSKADSSKKGSGKK
jgi:hypothetical protein